MKTKNELNIFQTSSIELLKSMYSRSKAYVTDKINLENEISLIVGCPGKDACNVTKLH